MARALKVFRTEAGFHDAYVAAPSQKAALEACGATANLFGLGMAEVVTDPALTEAPLAAPGKVIRIPRGTADEHLAALPQETASSAPRKKTGETRSDASSSARTKSARRSGKAPKPAPAPKPRPSRAGLDAAEAALAQADAAHRDVASALRAREQALQKERRALEADHDRKVARLQQAVDTAEARYQSALDRWRKA